MKVSYYKDQDFLYVEPADRPQIEGQELSGGITAHYDADGALVAIEVAEASTRADLGILSALGIKNVHVDAA